jgi:hypothetical protein
MLSTAGAQTRGPIAAPPAPETPAPVVEPQPAPIDAAEPAKTGSVSALPSPPKAQPPTEEAAPRTLRLRPATAAQLRSAWLQAKRDDVLLTAQDFASDLVEEALVRHRRRRAVSSS